ncbi:MAG: glycosyltransferase [Candidatus Hodarchaeota archaeon]
MSAILKPVSIIIPIKNRSYLLDNLIRNLLNLNYSEYEIIIVDDCSTDNTKELLNKYPIKLISLEKSVGSAKARNIGIKEAKYDIIALTDSDCFVSRNWLKNLVPYLNNYDMVGGRIVSCDRSETKLIPFNMEHETIINKESPMNFLDTSNVILKKDLWNSNGGFLNYRIEDLDFSWRVLKKGFKLIYAPKGLVIHIGIRPPLHNIKKYIQYGKYYSMLSILHKMELSFKTEPIFNKKSISMFINLNIYLLVLLVLIICNCAIFNLILLFSLIALSFIFIYLIVRLIKKFDINYKLFKFSLLSSIIVYYVTYILKIK